MSLVVNYFFLAGKIKRLSNVTFKDISTVIVDLLKTETGYDYEFKSEFYDIDQWIYLKRVDYEVKKVSDITCASNGEVIILAIPFLNYVYSVDFFDRKIDSVDISFLNDRNYDVNNKPLNVLRNFMFEFVDYQMRENLYEKELSVAEFYEMYKDSKECLLEDETDLLGYHDSAKRTCAMKREKDKFYKKRGISLKFKKEAEYRSNDRS